MVPRRYRVFMWAGPLVALGWLLLVFMDPQPPGDLGEYLGIGVFLGTMFGQTTVASAWTAFGPAPLVWRLPLSLLWVFMLGVALGINLAMRGGPDEAMVIIGLCLVGQWLLVQLPLWGLAMGSGLRLRHREDMSLMSDPRERQFGIRQLLIITTIVAVVFGIGRIIVPNLNFTGDATVFIFLAATAIVITLPMVIASLLPRLALRATLLTLGLVVVATVFELPLLHSTAGGQRGGPNAMHFVWINAFTTLWLLSLVMVVRCNGYTLAAPGLGVRK